MQRAKKYFLDAPLVTRIASGLYLLYIAVNMSRPLWFDEVWRAYQISNWKFIDPDNGSAPISPLFFLLTKMMTVISNNEITQRLIVIAVSLLLPFVTYYVMSRYFGRQIAVNTKRASPTEDLHAMIAEHKASEKGEWVSHSIDKIPFRCYADSVRIEQKDTGFLIFAENQKLPVLYPKNRTTVPMLHTVGFCLNDS